MKFLPTLLLFSMLLSANLICAQGQNNADSTEKVDVEIVEAGYMELISTDSNSFNKLVEQVKLKQDETIMTCDSAYLNTETNNVEAFGNVIITQPDGTQSISDYLRYTGNKKLAHLEGNVMLTDGKDNLRASQVEYDLNTKIGVYSNGGTLQSDATALTSNSGVYNMSTKDARFIEDVHVYDPEYTIVSDDMGYNTDTKVVTFFGASVVTSDSSILSTHCGTYKTEDQLAHFPCRSSVQTVEQYIEADSLFYNKAKGKAKARINVIAIDTVQESTLYCDVLDVNELKKTSLATVNPIMKKMNGKDSLFIAADTFFTGPVIPVPDSIKIVKTVGRGRRKKEVVTMIADTAAVVDTTDRRFFIGYHNVKIYSDSMQGLCDSIVYTQQDSVMKMIYEPILWSRKSQITGDTILLYMDDSNRLDEMFIPDKAFVVSQSGPDKAGLYDQIQGKTLTGFFHENTITEVLVKPNAEAIYYTQDDDGAYIGVNEATSARMRIRFKDEAIEKIILEQGVKQKMTPMDMADLPNLKLNRFHWLEDKRPKSLSELLPVNKNYLALPSNE